MVGFGIITIFMQCFNYLLDTYLQLYLPYPPVHYPIPYISFTKLTE